jgi:predicted RNase H-like HicB family nuclease
MDTPPSSSISLSAELHHDGEQFIASCPEIPEAKGRGATDMEALISLRTAVDEYFEARRAAQENTPSAPES